MVRGHVGVESAIGHIVEIFSMWRWNYLVYVSIPQNFSLPWREKLPVQALVMRPEKAQSALKNHNSVFREMTAIGDVLLVTPTFQ